MDFASDKDSQIDLLELVIGYMEKSGKYPFNNLNSIKEFRKKLVISECVKELCEHFKFLHDSFFRTIKESVSVRSFPCEESRKVFLLSSRIWGHPNEITSYGFIDEENLRKDRFLQELSTDVGNQVWFLECVVDFKNRFRRYPDWHDACFHVFIWKWLEIGISKKEYMEEMKILKEKFKKTRRSYYKMLNEMEENDKKLIRVGDEIWGENVKPKPRQRNTKSKPLDFSNGETSYIITSSSSTSSSFISLDTSSSSISSKQEEEVRDSELNSTDQESQAIRDSETDREMRDSEENHADEESQAIRDSETDREMRDSEENPADQESEEVRDSETAQEESEEMRDAEENPIDSEENRIDRESEEMRDAETDQEFQER